MPDCEEVLCSFSSHFKGLGVFPRVCTFIFSQILEVVSRGYGKFNFLFGKFQKPF